MDPQSEARRSLAQIAGHIAMIDYLVAELMDKSSLTAYLLQIARQNLLDEVVADNALSGEAKAKP
jgi:hypothetical protein